jgi:fumarate reductase flavoprotein subunit
VKEIGADIAVVGAGAAGLAAAITAAEGGASVVAFEKAPVAGGVASPENAGAMGFLAIESKLHRRQFVTLTREEALRIHMDYTHWRVDARLVKAYYDKSASTVDWLEKMGVQFTEPRPHNPSQNPTHHVIRGPEWQPTPYQPDPRDPRRRSPSGYVLGSVMTNRAKELGVRFFLETPARRLIKEDGRITGVIAQDKSGEEVRAKARAVIIATGGFSDNPEMIKKYIGFEWGRNLFSLRMPGLAGDGVRMAWEAGAAPTEMIMSLNCTLPVGFHPLRHTPAVMAFCQPNLIINLLGERFMNEEVIATNPAFAGNAVTIQKDGCAFAIFDEATKQHYEENGFYWRPEPIVGGFDNALKELRENWADFDKHVFVADSLEELASKTGINLDALQKTVAEYNIAGEKGRDELFNKNYRFLRPVKQPRFYAGRIAAAGFGSQGGIKINYKTEVLTREFEVIPGLYAAGADANSIYGDTYVFPLPGSMLGFALNSGRIASESALEYLKTLGK